MLEGHSKGKTTVNARCRGVKNRFHHSVNEHEDVFGSALGDEVGKGNWAWIIKVCI